MINPRAIVSRLSAWLDRQPKRLLIVMTALMIVLIGVVDYATGSELDSLVFYLLPIALAAWYIGSGAGILVSAASAACWLLVDAATSLYSHPLLPLFNGAIRLTFYLIVALTLSQLRAARDSEAVMQQFIVHDLRAPLGNVQTGLQAVELLGGEQLKESQRRAIRTALTSAQRMLQLINSLLDAARLEEHRMPVQASDVPVRELVDGAAEQVRLLAESREVALATQLDDRVSCVHADHELATRVLVNLYHNAIRYAPAGTPITLRVEPCEGGCLAFSVSDQGPGIAPEWQNQVFDRYSQIKARKAGTAVGSGLGLVFCRLAVEAQGGRIWLQSERGQGTTVTFTLPAPAGKPS